MTYQFLEDQAAEREQERDEAQKMIDEMTQQLKDRDKDRVNCQRFSSEVRYFASKHLLCTLLYSLTLHT